jgi:phosphoglycerol transferase MdoB-like AlkP superfamily enzyme
MKRCFNFSIIPVFLLSEVGYLLHFVGLSVSCTGSSQGYYAASHPICQELGDRLFVLDMFLVAPLIVLVWFLTLQRQGKWMLVLRSFGMIYLLLLRFMIASWVGGIEIEPSKWVG